MNFWQFEEFMVAPQPMLSQYYNLFWLIIGVYFVFHGTHLTPKWPKMHVKSMPKFNLGGNVEYFGSWVDKSKKTVNLANFKVILAYPSGLFWTPGVPLTPQMT